MENFDDIFDSCIRGTSRSSVMKDARSMALSSIVAFGRKTITGILRSSGRQFLDWTSAYRLFSRERFEMCGTFENISKIALRHFKADEPFVAALDDTVIRKKGRKIPGAGYRRDPMSLPFHPNIIIGQRFIQISACIPPQNPGAPARAVPVDFAHAPSAAKPGKKADESKLREYKIQKKELCLTRQGASRAAELRRRLDRAGRTDPFWLTVDGGYTNKGMYSNLPERCVLIGRVRKDAALFYPPEPSAERVRGRKPVYGLKAPTPEELRKDESAPWETAPVFAAGKIHELRYKTMENLRHRMSGETPLRLIVIAPLAYKLRKNGDTLYREPAYLICSDVKADLGKVIQAYFNRWDIEVNFRDEKTILGTGQAQVRSGSSVELAPGFVVANYAMLLLSAIEMFGVNGMPDVLPLPKWRRTAPNRRASTQDLVSLMRYELWGRGMGNFSGFAKEAVKGRSRFNSEPDLKSAVFYCRN